MRNTLALMKAFSHSEVHSNISFFLRVMKKRKALSATQKWKRDRAARRLVSYYTSFMLVGIFISIIS